MPISEYRLAIHRAVEQSKGRDFYTGEDLEWYLLNNQKPATPGRRGHLQRSRYPSVDHYHGPNRPTYKIYGGIVNHAKGALDHQQFVRLCRKVAKHHENWADGAD